MKAFKLEDAAMGGRFSPADLVVSTAICQNDPRSVFMHISYCHVCFILFIVISTESLRWLLF